MANKQTDSDMEVNDNVVETPKTVKAKDKSTPKTGKVKDKRQRSHELSDSGSEAPKSKKRASEPVASTSRASSVDLPVNQPDPNSTRDVIGSYAWPDSGAGPSYPFWLNPAHYGGGGDVEGHDDRSLASSVHSASDLNRTRDTPRETDSETVFTAPAGFGAGRVHRPPQALPTAPSRSSSKASTVMPPPLSRAGVPLVHGEAQVEVEKKAEVEVQPDFNLNSLATGVFGDKIREKHAQKAEEKKCGVTVDHNLAIMLDSYFQDKPTAKELSDLCKKYPKPRETDSETVFTAPAGFGAGRVHRPPQAFPTAPRSAVINYLSRERGEKLRQSLKPETYRHFCSTLEESGSPDTLFGGNLADSTRQLDTARKAAAAMRKETQSHSHSHSASSMPKNRPQGQSRATKPYQSQQGWQPRGPTFNIPLFTTPQQQQAWYQQQQQAFRARNPNQQQQQRPKAPNTGAAGGQKDFAKQRNQ